MHQSQSKNLDCFKKTNDKFQPKYCFNLKKRELSEFKAMCHYHQTSPESHFTQRRLLSLATEAGRVTLSKNRLIITENNQSSQKLLSSLDERIIKKHFHPFPISRSK